MNITPRPLLCVFGVALAALLLRPDAASGADRTGRAKEFGCDRVDFRVGKSAAFLILPAKKAEDGATPWLWFAPVLRDKYPNEWHDWLFSRLLNAGFAVGGVDVDESWGNPEGRAEYTKFYEYVVKEHGLSPKACLLAESRGALMALNWAAEHAKAVQCIAGIYPLCHITDGPFFARMYRLGENPEDDKQNDAALTEKFKEHNPIDRLAPLAAEKVPILLLHGGEDRFVPVGTNSAELILRYLKLGGSAKLILRRTARHEPCVDFFESEELLNFLLSQGKPPGKTTEKTEAKDKVPPAPDK